MEAHLLKDQEAVRRAFLGELQTDTPEYNLVDWLNQSLTVPAMMAERYLHYKDLGSQSQPNAPGMLQRRGKRLACQ